MTYAATCAYCGLVVLTVRRLDDPDLRQLREHLRTAHPHEVAHADTLGVADLLMHFRVVPTR